MTTGRINQVAALATSRAQAPDSCRFNRPEPREAIARFAIPSHVPKPRLACRRCRSKGSSKLARRLPRGLSEVPPGPSLTNRAAADSAEALPRASPASRTVAQASSNRPQDESSGQKATGLASGSDSTLAQRVAIQASHQSVRTIARKRRHCSSEPLSRQWRDRAKSRIASASDLGPPRPTVTHQATEPVPIGTGRFAGKANPDRELDRPLKQGRR